jgi:Protein of unknown function (DUF2721)
MISATITPAILILSAGSFVASSIVRLRRVSDQTRVPIAQSEQLRKQGKVVDLPSAERGTHRLLGRAELARNALWGYYVAIALFLLSGVILAINQATHAPFEWLGPSITLLGGLVLMLATLTLVIEVGMSAGSLREEVEAYEKHVEVTK